MGEKVEVENVNVPGHITRVDAVKYTIIRDLTLKCLPEDGTGLTAVEIKDAVRHKLPEDLFPGGRALGWWQKTVQLDLEAKGLMKRAETKPLSFFRV